MLVPNALVAYILTLMRFPYDKSNGLAYKDNSVILQLLVLIAVAYVPSQLLPVL